MLPKNVAYSHQPLFSFFSFSLFKIQKKHEDPWQTPQRGLTCKQDNMERVWTHVKTNCNFSTRPQSTILPSSIALHMCQLSDSVQRPSPIYALWSERLCLGRVQKLLGTHNLTRKALHEKWLKGGGGGTYGTGERCGESCVALKNCRLFTGCTQVLKSTKRMKILNDCDTCKMLI